MEHASVAQKTKAEPTSVSKKSASPQRAHSTDSLTRIPRWANFAYGNQVPSSLRLPTTQSPALDDVNGETMSITGDHLGIGNQLALEAAPREMGSLQARFEPTQNKENTTGLPDSLKVGIETLSGMTMDDVQVNYNSSKPAEVQAFAYTQGSTINIGPGQEQHLPHEAWHVVQQKQERVQATQQLMGIPLNNDHRLEDEADRFGEQATRIVSVPIKPIGNRPNTTSRRTSQPEQAVSSPASSIVLEAIHSPNLDKPVLQRKVFLDLEDTPAQNARVHILQISRPATPYLSLISGLPTQKGVPMAARHIIPEALLEREFKARYNGRTVNDLQKVFPTVAIDSNYLVNMAQALQNAFSWEIQSLNRGGVKMGKQPYGAVAPPNQLLFPVPVKGTPFNKKNPGVQSAPKADQYRNYWKGTQAGNLAKDVTASATLQVVENAITKKLGKYDYNTFDKNNIKFINYKANFNVESRIIEAVSQEFDPPPFASRKVIEEAAKEWARLTNSWLENDEESYYYYSISRPYDWNDAVLYGDNAIVYQNTK